GARHRPWRPPELSLCRDPVLLASELDEVEGDLTEEVGLEVSRRRHELVDNGVRLRGPAREDEQAELRHEPRYDGLRVAEQPGRGEAFFDEGLGLREASERSEGMPFVVTQPDMDNAARAHLLEELVR